MVSLRVGRGWSKSLKRFSKDEDGTLTAFIAVAFASIFVGAGMAVDFMRQENLRTELQGALDRGVLAVAERDVVQDEEEMILSYMRATSFTDDFSLSINRRVENKRKVVVAELTASIPTYFLRMIGLTRLESTVSSSAVEGIRSIEISLVVDVSGSMPLTDTNTGADGLTLLQNYPYQSALQWAGGTTASRLDLLKVVADEFVQQVLEFEAGDITVSIVPFSGHVNVGPEAYDYFDPITNKPAPDPNAVARDHGLSHCLDIPESYYDVVDLPGPGQASHVAHFQYWTTPPNATFTNFGYCPTDGQAIVYHSADETLLREAIRDLRGHESTSSQIGMKWGLALVDPTSRPLTAALNAAGVVDDAFAAYPRDYDPANLKLVVLLSDGEIFGQVRPNRPLIALDPARFPDPDVLEDTPLITLEEELTSIFKPTSEAYGELDALCDIAKTEGVIVFTVGFGISATSTAADSLRDCASDVAMFYNVAGDDLAPAFSDIVGTISKLRLVN